MREAGESLIYIKPKHAWKRLKAADEENVTAYVYGISGSGKTEFITRYLGRKKYLVFQAGQVTAKDLKPAESGRRKIIVIDNLQELAQDENCDNEDVKKAIIALIRREDVWVILCSRGEVLPWLTAIRYQEVFYVIGEKELLFDDRQVEKYIAQTGMLFTEKQQKLLENYCNGVPITWNIINSVYQEMDVQEETERRQEPFGEKDFRTLVEKARSRMWDYLEYHVYDEWDVQIQEFLMEISIVDCFHVRLAEMITGRKDVEALLNRIRWLGNFMHEERGANGDRKSVV